MISKRYDLDEDTVSKIHTIKKAKGFKSEKEVLVQAIEHYALSEMIEHESAEYKTLQKMNAIENELKQLKNKLNYVDHGVSVNNLFLASEFELARHPRAIINRDTLEGEYYSSARKEITKMIRERDSYKRKGKSKDITETFEQNKSDESISVEKKKPSIEIDDDWLNV